MLIDLQFLSDIALFGLRLVVALVFLSSGWSHVRRPEERGESIGMSPAVTTFLGAMEILGACMVAAGIFIQIGALVLAVVMIGAIFKKIFVWGTGFYSDEGYGWHYDLIFLTAHLFFATYGGGQLVLLN